MANNELVKLAQIMNPEKPQLPYEKFKSLFVKVAFDVFQPSGSPVESYWILEKGDDGKEYLVSNYEDSDISISATDEWQALPDKQAKNITLSYKDTPIKRLASSDFGFSQEDIHVFTSALLSKLASDKGFVSKLLETLPENKKEALIKTFPELK